MKRNSARSWILGFGLLMVGWSLAGCAAQPGAPRTGAGTFFVATNGNDSWSGRVAAPARNGRDGPFATVPRALEAIREERSHPRGVGAPTLYVRDGTYFLTSPVVLKPEDSSLRLMAYPGERPVLSAGRAIAGWKEVDVSGKKLWAAEIPGARAGKWFFRELWVNGERRTRARHPNKGYFSIEGLPDKAKEWTQGHTRFQFHAGDLKVWPSLTNAEVVAMTRWVESRLPVAGVDEAGQLVSFTKRSVFELQVDDLYYIEHVFEALDAPGEWYLDAAKGILFYAPLPGERPGKIEAIAPVQSQVLRLEGQPQTGQFVSDVEFNGLTFAHAEWNLAKVGDTNAAPGWPARTSEVGGFNQAAIGVPGAVWGEGVRHCVFTNCTFAQVGTYGLELARGCRSNRITHCEFADLGAGGIKIGETAIRPVAAEQTEGNEISDCRIHDGGKTFQSAIGVWIGQSPNNRIAHNLIHDFYYTGISIGWTWGYGPALASNNIVEFNHIHHIGVQSDGDGPVLSDMAGIYTLGKQPGTRIVNNLWHDMAATKYGGWGIYFDEGSSGILAESNVVYRTTHGGFHQHYGETNIVRNNIFAFARDQQLQRSRDEEHVSFSFSNNIVLFDKGVLLGSTWKNDQFILDRNIYWDTRLTNNPTEMKFAGSTLEKWQGRGHDKNSQVADPLFAAPQRDDFTLNAKSPALKAGFQRINLRHVGPRP
ncbi:MAG: right-handed parallel beta-helix repeat-containing protein [Pedosphaera sp.]|nr:right-handed parallel beta-helix repeat-containing protein [Pedosphaera sp.]